VGQLASLGQLTFTGDGISTQRGELTHQRGRGLRSGIMSSATSDATSTTTAPDKTGTGGPRRIPVVIDTDAGIDDAVALWWALTDPRVEVRAITTVHGNVDIAEATANAAIIVAATGRTDVPIGRGSGVPVGPVPELRKATFVHGDDGLGDCGLVPDMPADEVLASLGFVVGEASEVLRAHADGAVLVTLGPLTTVARALQADPTLARRFRRLVVMGGAFASPGNAYPVAEANIAHDPAAAAIVFGADWAEPPLLVGLDVTHEATFDSSVVALLGEHRNAAATFCDAPLRFYAGAGGTFCEPGTFSCHDLLATMAAVIDDLVTGPLLRVGVQTAAGPAWGMTVADFRQPFFERAGHPQASPDGFVDCVVALEVNLPRWRAEVRTLFGG
jgi:purine nucleosidase